MRPARGEVWAVEPFDGNEWDVEQDEPGFRWKRLRLGRRLEAELLGASLFELPPGERSFPMHLHHANEELLLMLDGQVVVRRLDREEELVAGAAVVFPRGAQGAHQILNRGDRPARFLLVSTMREPDITEFPDTGKVGLFAGAAPGSPSGDAVKRFVAGEDVPYFDGEHGGTD